MKRIGYFLIMLCIGWLLITSLSCNHKVNNKAESKPASPPADKKFKPKPGSTYSDTLVINYPATVFYHPDSLQLLRIKSQTDSMVFDGSMHEFFYQMRNARMVIKETLPGLSIIESENYRYIRFIKKDNTGEYIDLNTKNDAYGLFIFNGKKSPLFVDMTNIETAISIYFKE